MHLCIHASVHTYTSTLSTLSTPGLLGYTVQKLTACIFYAELYSIRSDFAQYNHLIFAPALVEEKDTIAQKVHEYSRRQHPNATVVRITV
jgi:hypothetical protein